MILLIGSKALKYWDRSSRFGSDFDIIGSRVDYEMLVTQNQNQITSDVPTSSGLKRHIRLGDDKLEFEFLSPNSSNEILINLSSGPVVHMWGTDVLVADPLVLFTIKKSHLNYPINWWKHIKDYHTLKTMVDQSKLTEKHLLALSKRTKETSYRYGKLSKPNLMVPNETFFGKSQRVVNRTYNHDDLHLSTCFYDRPMYEKLKTDQTLAWCDGKLFERLDYSDKIKCVQEEAFAIALERKVIPDMNYNKEVNPVAAFRYAIERIGTTLTSGWFREFTQENVPQIMKHNVDYVGRFLAYLDRRSV